MQSDGSSSSSAVAPGAEAEELREPRIVLSDVWSAYEEWSSYGLGVPLYLKSIDSKVTQHYTPSLSAIQIFTIKPFLGDASSSRFELFVSQCLIASWVPRSDVKVCVFIIVVILWMD